MSFKRGGIFIMLSLMLVFPTNSSERKIQPASAQSTKLVSMPEFGDVNFYQISPDSQYVVYAADQDTDNVRELYSLRLPNGTPVKLNGPLGPEGKVRSFSISPDSDWVVYLVYEESEGEYALYGVPVSGPSTAAVRLSSSPPSGTTRISDYHISPDSSYAVFIADQFVDNHYELFRVPIHGPASGAVKLSSGQEVDRFAISPDGHWVVFKAQSRPYQDEIYSIPLNGNSGDAVIINHPLRITLFVCVPTGDETRDSVHNFAISPDSSRVVYDASFVDDEAPGVCYDEVRELYSVPIGGPQGQAVQIQAAPYDFYDVREFAVSSDSNRVVYTTYYQKTKELHSVPILGPTEASVKLSPNLVADGDVFDFRISPDSSRVVYVADQETDGTFELYSVPISGPSGSGIKISQPMTGGAEVDEWNFEITPDSSRVVYVAGQVYVDWNVFSVPIAGPTSQVVQISGPMTPGGFVYDFGTRFRISPDGAQALYRADQDTQGMSELFMAPVAGPPGSSVKINGSMHPDGDISDRYSEPEYAFCPNNECVLYVADQDTDDVYELYGYFEDGGMTQAIYLPMVIH